MCKARHMVRGVELARPHWACRLTLGNFQVFSNPEVPCFLVLLMWVGWALCVWYWFCLGTRQAASWSIIKSAVRLPQMYTEQEKLDLCQAVYLVLIFRLCYHMYFQPSHFLVKCTWFLQWLFQCFLWPWSHCPSSPLYLLKLFSTMYQAALALHTINHRKYPVYWGVSGLFKG